MTEITAIAESIARDCALCVRSALTIEQYGELVRNIALAIQAERDDHDATIRHCNKGYELLSKQLRVG